MKKLVSILLVLVLALACSASAFADGDPITLKFWHHRGSGAQYECGSHHAVNGFNETVGAEKGIVVEESYIGGYVDPVLPDSAGRAVRRCARTSSARRTPTRPTCWKTI